MGGDKGFIQQFIEWIIHNGGYFSFVCHFAEQDCLLGSFYPRSLCLQQVFI